MLSEFSLIWTSFLKLKKINDNYYISSEANNGYIGELCGTLTGQHMYLEAGGAGMPSTVMGTHTFMGTFNRRFRYKVSYIDCGKSWTPDPGCRQYLFGLSGVATSYNYDGGHHLNLQRYT